MAKGLSRPINISPMKLRKPVLSRVWGEPSCPPRFISGGPMATSNLRTRSGGILTPLEMRGGHYVTKEKGVITWVPNESC